MLDGEGLDRRLSEGAMPVRKAVEIAAAIGRGLAAAHEKGIAHRDLKPANVFLLADGQVKILDFGLARTTPETSSAAATQAALTDPGTVVGTAGYIAPEQVRGAARAPPRATGVGHGPSAMLSTLSFPRRRRFPPTRFSVSRPALSRCPRTARIWPT
ncbi:MAG TPA: protein kinase [Vicinamibacterales bacterium]|nr:protein kinase [Vicinamibacterales bacterium]